MKNEIRDYYLQHGDLDGFVESKVTQNDKKWFVFLLGIIICFTYFYAQKPKVILLDNSAIYQAKYDSIQHHLDTLYNSIPSYVPEYK